MVTTGDGLVIGVVIKRAVSGSTVRRSDSRASHVGVMTGAVVMGARSKSSMASGRSSGDSGDFRVTKLVVALLALPELVTGTLGVAVGWAGAEAFLLLVVTAKQDLHGDGKKEEEGSNDSDGETGSVEPASSAKGCSVGDLVSLTVAAKALPGVAGTVAKGSVDIAGAARCAIAGENGNSDHSTAAENVEY